MKITASRRDEVAKQESEYMRDYNAKKAAYDEDYSKYLYARSYNLATIENEIRNQLSPVIKDYPVTIDVRGLWGELEVSIKRENHKSDEIALSWSWSATISEDTGEVKTESNSWSGMRAVTQEQVEDLVKTADVLRAIVGIDWDAILKKGLQDAPDYSEYITHDNPGSQPKTFDNEYILADVYDAIDEGKFIKGDAINATGLVSSSKVYYKVVGETDSSFRIIYFSERDYQRAQNSGNSVSIFGPITVRKATLLHAIAKKNVETLDDPNSNLATL